MTRKEILLNNKLDQEFKPVDPMLPTKIWNLVLVVLISSLAITAIFSSAVEITIVEFFMVLFMVGTGVHYLWADYKEDRHQRRHAVYEYEVQNELYRHLFLRKLSFEEIRESYIRRLPEGRTIFKDYLETVVKHKEGTSFNNGRYLKLHMFTDNFGTGGGDVIH